MSVKRPNNLVSFGCLHPRVIYDKKGSPRLVACRQCAYCRMHRAQTLSSLGSLEALHNPNILFVTLTYSNENIPKASYLVENENELIITDNGKDIHFNVPYSKLILFDRSSGELFDSFITNKFTIDYVRKVSKYYNKRFPKFFSSSEIPVLKKSDAQKFVKRVRTYFKREYQEKACFRSLYCGEYGPTTNRPHFHFLFFCSSALERARLYILLRKNLFSKHPIWPFGNLVQKYYTGKGCGYLTSYLQGTSFISDVQSRSVFRSFCSHSVRFGCKPYEEQLKTFPQCRPRTYNVFNFIVDGKNTSVHLCPSIESTIYPRCRNFDGLSSDELFKHYSFALGYIQRSKWLDTASKLASHIVQEIKDFQYEGISMPLYCSVFGYRPLDADVSSKTLYNKIYYDCLISFKFIKNCPRELSYMSYIELICKYYQSKLDYFLEQDKENIYYLDNEVDDIHCPSDYFIYKYSIDDEFDFETLLDYTNSQPFKDWKKYCYMRLYDASKMKKFKDFYTNKFYSNKDFFNYLKSHCNE